MLIMYYTNNKNTFKIIKMVKYKIINYHKLKLNVKC